MVAGGLGERLGYPSIKIVIQIDLITLKAYEAKVHKKDANLDKDWFIPLYIITSGDAHDKSVKF